MKTCPKCGRESNGNYCPSCGTYLPASPTYTNSNPQTYQLQKNVDFINNEITQPNPSNYSNQNSVCSQPKKKDNTAAKVVLFSVLGTVIPLLILLLIMICTSRPKDNVYPSPSPSPSVSSPASNSAVEPKINVPDFSSMNKDEIQNWASENNITCKILDEYSDTVEAGNFVFQSIKANDSVKKGDTITIIFSLGKEPSIEFKNALQQAESYSDFLHMSKQGIYDQLISEYGGKFTKEAAQYAIDHIKADWNQNALEQARSYQQNLHMSKAAIYDQLISKYGGQFTKEEAQYAIDHLED